MNLTNFEVMNLLDQLSKRSEHTHDLILIGNSSRLKQCIISLLRVDIRIKVIQWRLVLVTLECDADNSLHTESNESLILLGLYLDQGWQLDNSLEQSSLHEA